MRKRINRIQVRLNDTKKDILEKKCIKANISKSDYFRRCILNKQIKEQPSKDLTKLIQQLYKIGNNVNQIAKNTNIFNEVLPQDFRDAQMELRNLIENVENTLYDKGG